MGAPSSAKLAGRPRPFTQRSRSFRLLFNSGAYGGIKAVRSRPPVMVEMNQTSVSDLVLCAGCELDVAWPPLERDGQAYCCAGCAAGGPCCCSYDDAPEQDPQSKYPNRRST